MNSRRMLLKKFERFLCIALCLLVFSFCKKQPHPQKPDPVRRKSPIAIAKTKDPATNTYIKIVYGQPYKHGRVIFGNLVPYDKVWRTGANEATELTTTKNIDFGGQKLKAGTYALFSIPHRDSTWTIILNNDLGQWGAFEYKENKDHTRVEVQSSKQKKTTEVFTIHFDKIKNEKTNIIMDWSNTRVMIPVEFL